MTWEIIQGDCLQVMASIPADSVQLVFGSPPYEAARSYGIGFDLRGQDWVDFMVEVYRASVRVCTGLVAFVVGHGQGLYNWSAAPYLLVADLKRAGFHCRPTLFFHRNGIPGSGQKDWMRADVEHIVCVTAKPGQLPWSDNTAHGHAPKWAPGGAMSYRNEEGRRKNERNYSGMNNAERKRAHRRLERSNEKASIGRRITRGTKNGDTENSDSYDPPVKANPGNLIQDRYTAAEVAEILKAYGIDDGEVRKHLVGGGVMGSKLAHLSEAPFPEELAAFFIQSFCEPGKTVLDPFSGSATTIAVAVRHNRRAIGIDIRESQVELGRKRVMGETPMGLFA